MIGFLGPRATPGVETVDGGCYRRTIRLDEGPGWLEVRPEAPPSRAGRRGPGHLLLAIHARAGRELVLLVERVHRMFDLDSDPRVINEVLRHDPLLAPLVRARPGARVPGAWDGFELAVRALLGQQVTVAGATTLAGRLCDAFGEPGPFSGTGLSRLFPTPAALADGDVARIGMPRRRAEAIRTLAREVRDGRIVLEPSADPGETATRLEMAARLGRIAGIGDWTVQYVAMRALRDPDGFPAGDLGLLRAVARSLPEGERRTLNASALARRAEAWRPWRAYAAIQLWLSGSAEGQARRQAPPK